MPDSPDGAVLDGPTPRPASPLATFVGWGTLRLGGYPGRSLMGTFWRKEARRRGGESFYFHGAGGTRLAGWYSPAKGTAAAEAGGQRTPRLPVVISHGWVETKECHFRQAWRLNERGHDVVLFDHRSHGRSKGGWVTFGVREREDLRAAVDAAAQRGMIGERCLTMGFSLGAATALQHAANDPRVAGVVAFAPFVDFREAIRSFRDKLAPWIDETWLLRGFEKASRRAGFDLHEASTLEAFRRIEQPVLLVEAACDTDLPPHAHTRKLIAAKTRGRLEVLTVAQARHRNLCRRGWPGLHEAVADFCASIR